MTRTRPKAGAPADPFAHPDVAAFLALVREYRTQELADAAAGGDFATQEVRALALLVDEVLVDHGGPPVVQLVLSAEDLELLSVAREDADPDD